MVFQSFEDLEVWKRSCLLAVFVYETLKECRDFGMRNQMQRSAVSVASNIAEGSERGAKDFDRFLRIARGSAAELRTQTWIAQTVGIIPTDPALHIIEETKGIARMLTGLSKSLNTPR
jgi:four helix bundle protein